MLRAVVCYARTFALWAALFGICCPLRAAALADTAPAQDVEPCPGAGSIVPTPTTSRASPSRPLEPDVHVTPAWLLLQLVPSTGLVSNRRQTDLALGWQFTPVLWAHGLDPRLSAFRFFVAEPIVRQSGSLELSLEPQYWATYVAASERWGGKAGLRATLPIHHRGEYLSMSIASGYFWFPADDGAYVETAAYVLFGFVGLSLGANLGRHEVSWQSMLRLRVF